jgi:hypothetical protein
MTEEDEAFNEIERQAKQRKESVMVAMQRNFEYTFYQVTRNQTIEEVAQEIEKFKGFGQDTISSFAIYIREMKK